jgi:RNA polymerase sigma-70 factor (ECF subfamily)
MQTAAIQSAAEHAYARLVEPFRGELHAHCCRMLRSPDDAEEALQEALLRAWRGLPSFEGRSSLRAWLYKVSTNACLDEIERRRTRVVPLDGGAPFEPGPTDGVAVEPVDQALSPAEGYERRESLEHVLASAFEHLSPQARTVLVLRTALGFRAREVADRLDTTVASVNSALQRARATLGEYSARAVPEYGRTLRTPGVRNLVEGCADAIERGDADGAVKWLSES